MLNITISGTGEKKTVSLIHPTNGQDMIEDIVAHLDLFQGLKSGAVSFELTNSEYETLLEVVALNEQLNNLVIEVGGDIAQDMYYDVFEDGDMRTPTLSELPSLIDTQMMVLRYGAAEIVMDSSDIAEPFINSDDELEVVATGFFTMTLTDGGNKFKAKLTAYYDTSSKTIEFNDNVEYTAILYGSQSIAVRTFLENALTESFEDSGYEVLANSEA